MLGGLNSGPCDRRESTLLSEPSPCSPQTVLILYDDLLLLGLTPYLKKYVGCPFLSLSLFGRRLEPRSPIDKQLLPTSILKAPLAPS